ncbi:hypothetical protein ACQEVS_28905 [Streptomyces sp. CA-181903]|uniref:hypothetical protein n=1 Tax=Streptomyces sp. CA-181903 TaxID=3240055 RepID=UPI003D8F949F
MSDPRRTHQPYRADAQVRDPGRRRVGEAMGDEETFIQLCLFERTLDGGVDAVAPHLPFPDEVHCAGERQQGDAPVEGPEGRAEDAVGAWVPQPLELVVDTERDQVGVVVGRDAGTGRITLRPPEGGRVWHPVKCRRANAMDRLRARVIQQNREGRRW